MRQHTVGRGAITVIEDCYNAAPESMQAALAVLQERPEKRHVALLGDMLELGPITEAAHRAVGELAADTGVGLLITVGELAKGMNAAAQAKGAATLHCQTAKDVVNCLQQHLRPGDVLLAKASHAVGLEQALEEYYRSV